MKTFIATHGLVLCVSLAVGMWLGHEWEEQRIYFQPEHRISSYVNGQLTNQLLECFEGAESLSIGDRASVEETVTAYIAEAQEKRIISDAAVYFHDLNNGPWFGINERVPYTPGSLLKLPIAMAYHRAAESRHHFLDEKIEYLGTNAPRVIEAEFDSDSPLPTGVYSLQDLLALMLKQSSNDAADVLVEYARGDFLTSTFTDLGIEEPAVDADYEIDVKTFGAFFRVLFNASYLSHRSSEELLTILTQTTFRDGLVAGVPSTVQVAHKFGTRVTDDPDAPRQLHDCGIVYAPKTPYILCVMACGDSAKNLSYFISQVSRKVYAGVTQ